MNVLIGIVIGTVSLQFLIQSTVAKSPPDECLCPAIYDPVCGDNDITYSSECSLNCASNKNLKEGYPPIKVAYSGECKLESCNCPATVQPVCGTDGRTYINECKLEWYNKRRQECSLPIIEIVCQGECTTGPNCPWISMPVCGTDERTYRNVCYLQYESQQNVLKGLPPIFLKSIGRCPQDNCICPMIEAPLCASNGKTYINECTLACENRRRKELGQPQLTIINNGECEVGCTCTKEYNPVCGSDGNTYANPCIFNCENLRRLKEGLPLLLIDYYGECENCICPLYVDPVCGSDDITYSNRCFLGCENKKRAKQNLPPISEVDCVTK